MLTVYLVLSLQISVLTMYLVLSLQMSVLTVYLCCHYRSLC